MMSKSITLNGIKYLGSNSKIHTVEGILLNGEDLEEISPISARNACAVGQFNEIGELIARYSSGLVANKINGIDPSWLYKACRKGYKAKGYYWRYL